MVVILDIWGIVFDKTTTDFLSVFLSSLTKYSARYVVRLLFVSMWDKKSLSVIPYNSVESLIIYLICLPEMHFSRHCSLKERFKYQSKTNRISSNSLASCRRRFLKAVVISLQVFICGVVCICSIKPLHQ